MDSVSHTLDTRTQSSEIAGEADGPPSRRRRRPKRAEAAAPRDSRARMIHREATTRADRIVQNLVDLVTEAFKNGDRITDATDHLLHLLADARALQMDVEEIEGLPW